MFPADYMVAAPLMLGGTEKFRTKIIGGGGGGEGGGGELSKKLNLGDEVNLRRGAMKLNECVTTTNMLVFWLACLSCLPVCQSVDDSGHKGNTGQLLNSRVLGVL